MNENDEVNVVRAITKGWLSGLPPSEGIQSSAPNAAGYHPPVSGKTLIAPFPEAVSSTDNGAAGIFCNQLNVAVTGTDAVGPDHTM